MGEDVKYVTEEVSEEEFHSFLTSVDANRTVTVQQGQFSALSISNIVLFVTVVGLGLYVNTTRDYYAWDLLFFPVPLCLFCLLNILVCFSIHRLPYAWCLNVIMVLFITSFGWPIVSVMYVICSFVSNLVATSYRKWIFDTKPYSDTKRFPISIADLFFYTLAMSGYFFILKTKLEPYLQTGDEIMSSTSELPWVSGYGSINHSLLYYLSFCAFALALVASSSTILFLRKVSFFKIWFFYVSLLPIPMAIYGLLKLNLLISLTLVICNYILLTRYYKRNQSWYMTWLMNVGLLLIPAFYAMIFTGVMQSKNFIDILVIPILGSIPISFCILMGIGTIYIFCIFISEEQIQLSYSDQNAIFSQTKKEEIKPVLGPLD